MAATAISEGEGSAVRNTTLQKPDCSRPSIAHLLPWPSIGGVEIATIRLITATLHEFRHIAFCIEGSVQLMAACHEAGAEVVSYTPPEPSFRHFGRFHRESKVVASKLLQSGADLVHCSEVKAVYHNSLAARLAHVPLITHVRCRISKLDFRERITMFPVQRYIFVSKDSWHQFAFRVSDRKARVLYDAVSTAEPAMDAEAVREELGVLPGDPLIGMVARVNPQKDYFTLAAAAAEVLSVRPDARFVIVGDNSEVELNRKHFAAVRAKLEEYGIYDRFIFTGFRKDVPRLVSAMDVYVLSTHREGLPLSILEGMAMGKPVVATAVDGVPEVITDRVTGSLHAHQDSHGLAKAILEYIDNPERANQVGLAAREHVRSQFNRDTYARNTIAIYRELLRSRQC